MHAATPRPLRPSVEPSTPRPHAIVAASLQHLAALLVRLAPCPGCGAPPATSSGVCVTCRDEPRVARRDGDVLALGAYAGTLGALVRAAKFAGSGRLLDDLGLPLATGLARASEDDASLRGAWLVPVPSHRRRRARRGPDPSERLARAVVRAGTGHRLAPVLRRARHGPAQSTLRHTERLANVRGAFVLADAWVSLLPGRRLILVDDVLTTGATARAAAAPLRAAGAEVVLVLVVAGPSGS